MNHRYTRRDVLRTTGLASAGVLLGRGAFARPMANDRLNVAVIGIGGRGRANLNAIARTENIVALCDVDDARAGDAYEKFPQARRFRDFRRMFDAMADEIDAVVVSTPDHTHFHPCHAALQLKKHLYVEKPLAHNPWEVRTLTDLAREQGVATQLGVQRHALPNVHRAVEIVQSGLLGEIKRCYAWVGGERGMPNKPTGPDGFPAVPDHLDWDLWMGPTAPRRYSPAYCPYEWRFWWPYGTGEMGNWGCHVLDIPFWALGLKYPFQVGAAGPPADLDRTPKSMNSALDFAARGDAPPVKLFWLHTKDGPEILKASGMPHLGTGVLFLGSKGTLLCDFSKLHLYPEDIEVPAPSIPDSPGFHREWIDACKGGPPATCEFDYSGPLTEAVLLANIAYRTRGGKDWVTQWDGPALEFSEPKSQAYVREEYREGWKV